MPYHNCPTCTCETEKQIRERMRNLGHTCVWANEVIYAEHEGYSDTDCVKCELERKLK
jgi:hypothetical protein